MNVATVPIATRATIVLAGVGLAVVPSPAHPFPLVLTVLAALVAAAFPEQVGALAPSVAFGIGWLAAGGWHATPDVARTVVAAALLYVLHQAVALACVLPLDAVVAPGVLRRWLVRCVPAVAIAAVVIAVDLSVSSRSGSPAIEVAALVGVLVVLGLGLGAVLAPPGGPQDERTS